ncbi:hypothetical protein [Streptomyces sp. NPDC004658]
MSHAEPRSSPTAPAGSALADQAGGRALPPDGEEPARIRAAEPEGER